MSSPDVSTAAPSELLPENLGEAGVYRTMAEGFEHGLVVLAMGLPCWLVPFGHRHRLLVERPALTAVHEELACFDRESINWPPAPIAAPGPARATELITPLLWALVVLVVFRGQAAHPEWTDAGALDAQAIFDRAEWWRLASALFLHADAAHVISNALSGILVFTALISTVGRLRGWLLLTAASVMGNLSVAAMHYPEEYRSLGASTAIFAGVGLLTGRAIRILRYSDRLRRGRAMFVALAGGLTVLGLYGAGGQHIDVLAHATGFAAGLVGGFAAAISRGQPPPSATGTTSIPATSEHRSV